MLLASLLLILCGSCPLVAQQTKASEKPADTNGQFSEETAIRLLDQLLQGLQSHNEQEFLSSFDPQFMTNYGEFADQVDVFFTQYENFIGRYHVREGGNDPDHPAVLVQFDLEGQPVVSGAPFRKSAQVRFEFARGKNGWKIVNLTPRGFFS